MGTAGITRGFYENVQEAASHIVDVLSGYWRSIRSLLPPMTGRPMSFWKLLTETRNWLSVAVNFHLILRTAVWYCEIQKKT